MLDEVHTRLLNQISRIERDLPFAYAKKTCQRNLWRVKGNEMKMLDHHMNWVIAYVSSFFSAIAEDSSFLKFLPKNSAVEPWLLCVKYIMMQELFHKRL